jgi:hypothetical protein
MDLSVLSGTHQILQHKLAGDPPFFLADALTAGQGCRISAYAAEYFLYVKNCSISSSAYKRIRATFSRPLTWDTALRLNSFVAVSPGLSLSLPVTSAYILYGAGFWIEAYAVPVTLS